MKLVIINGSPRAQESNSDVILKWITREMDKNISIEKYYTTKTHTHKEAVDAVKHNSTILVIFPLYVDAMPGITKLFFEELESLKNKKENVKIYFIVHSGFDGAKHCRAVERYLVYLSEYLGFKYMGTAIKPGSEGFRLIPDEYTIDIRNRFIELSKDITKEEAFNTEILKEIAGFEMPSQEYIEYINHCKGETKYASDLLKANGNFKNSFDKPYQRKS